MEFLIAGLIGFVIGFVIGLLVLTYLYKKRTGGLASGYDKQAFNGDANSALRYLKEGKEEKVVAMLNQIIRRTGMGWRDSVKEFSEKKGKW